MFRTILNVNCGVICLQSPKKVNLVAELVRGMRVDDALMQMAVSPKRAAKVVAKVSPSSHVESHFIQGCSLRHILYSEGDVKESADHGCCVQWARSRGGINVLTF